MMIESCLFRLSAGWLKGPKGEWSFKFHRDESSWSKYPFVFIDKGMPMPDGSPALLKSRKHLSRNDAVKIWKNLISQGWKRVNAQW